MLKNRVLSSFIGALKLAFGRRYIGEPPVLLEPPDWEKSIVRTGMNISKLRSVRAPTLVRPAGLVTAVVESPGAAVTAPAIPSPYAPRDINWSPLVARAVWPKRSTKIKIAEIEIFFMKASHDIWRQTFAKYPKITPVVKYCRRHLKNMSNIRI